MGHEGVGMVSRDPGRLCVDCLFRWTAAKYGVGTYKKAGNTRPWWTVVPYGTLPVFSEES